MNSIKLQTNQEDDAAISGQWLSANLHCLVLSLADEQEHRGGKMKNIRMPSSSTGNESHPEVPLLALFSASRTLSTRHSANTVRSEINRPFFRLCFGFVIGHLCTIFHSLNVDPFARKVPAA